ncbi:MAG: hypothetical protein ACXV3U_07025, partial [Halobacteriota archaeon]
DAGMLIDPYDTDQLAQAIITVLGDDELKREMSRKGIAQAQKFSWEKASEAYIALLKHILHTSECKHAKSFGRD